MVSDPWSGNRWRASLMSWIPTSLAGIKLSAEGVAEALIPIDPSGEPLLATFEGDRIVVGPRLRNHGQGKFLGRGNLPSSGDRIGPGDAIQLDAGAVINQARLQESGGPSEAAIHGIVGDHFSDWHGKHFRLRRDPISLAVGSGHPEGSRCIGEPVIAGGQARKSSPGSIPEGFKTDLALMIEVAFPCQDETQPASKPIGESADIGCGENIVRRHGVCEPVDSELFCHALAALRLAMVAEASVETPWSRMKGAL